VILVTQITAFVNRLPLCEVADPGVIGRFPVDLTKVVKVLHDSMIEHPSLTFVPLKLIQPPLEC
jgi:hypothetical protein